MCVQTESYFLGQSQEATEIVIYWTELVKQYNFDASKLRLSFLWTKIHLAYCHKPF